MAANGCHNSSSNGNTVSMAVLLVWMAMAQLVYWTDADPLPCEKSGMCSLDKVKPFFGDITPSEYTFWC
jgi:hypothetical protein